MRINQTNGPSNSSSAAASETSNSKKSEKIKSGAYEARSENSAAAKGTDNATAEISTKAKNMAKAQQLAMDTPDVRESKIASLREQIQNKKYNVSASDVSDRLVDDHIRLAGA